MVKTRMVKLVLFLNIMLDKTCNGERESHGVVMNMFYNFQTMNRCSLCGRELFLLR